MSTANTTAQFSIRIPEELKGSLEAISEISRRSKSQIVIKAITEYVDRNKWKLKAIQQAKQEAEQWVFISQESIINWLESWGTENELPEPTADVFHK